MYVSCIYLSGLYLSQTGEANVIYIIVASHLIKGVVSGSENPLTYLGIVYDK